MSSICSQCNASNAESAKFCKTCGQALAPLQTRQMLEPSPQALTSTMACHKCGEGNATAAKFCKACGLSLISAPAPAPAPEVVEASVARPAVAQNLVFEKQDEVLPASIGIEARRSSAPLYIGLGALALALLGVLIWVFTGVKSGQLAPPGSPQAATKIESAEVIDAAKPAAPPTIINAPSASAAPTSAPAKVEKEEISLPNPATKSTPFAALTEKPAKPLQPVKPAQPAPRITTSEAAPVQTPATIPAQPATRPIQPTPQEATVGQAQPRTEPAVSLPSSPKEACGKRIFLAQAICMQEQCASARFNAHPQCVQMRQQQKDTQERMGNSN